MQETNLSNEVLQLLIKLVQNSSQDIFKLGFALGGDRYGFSPRMLKEKGDGSQKFILSNSLISKINRLLNLIIFF